MSEGPLPPGWRHRLALRFPRLAGVVERARARAVRIWRRNAPGPRTWNGAALGLLIATLVVVADAVVHGALLPSPTWSRVGDALERIREGVLAGVGLVVLASVVARTPWRYRLALGVGGGLLAGLYPFSLEWRTLVGGIVAFSLLGAGTAFFASRDPGDATRLQRVAAALALVAGIACVVFLVTWLGSSGYDPVEYRDAAAEAAAGAATVEPLSLPDPSAPGTFTVLTLTYGSGDDIRRREFGRGADLITEPVDGRPFLEAWSGDAGRARREFWGFDRDELPLQGRVWYPEGDGPFPLVLIVHGNHRMEEYSDPGYGYLGELLASRGIILVSVDENFINGGIRGENDARGWLLLEHLRVWEEWNGTAESPFAGKVDLSRIGLVGHSRGGEAVAVAAAFNRLPYYPDDATVPFDYGFDIGAVAAIAPVMGQYRPGGRFTDLTDVNYLVIHGAHDGDVSSFNGAGQYEHVNFSGGPYRFKSSVYVMNANHGQFNTVWGDHDSGLPFGRGLNVRPLIPDEGQRKVAEVYISAFLEATLRGQLGYLPLFADARRGEPWLPDTAYLVEFDDSRSTKVATFDEDVDVTTATLAGGRTRGEGLTVWREQQVEMKSRTKETAGVYLGWKVDEDTGDEDTAAPAAEAEAGENANAPDQEETAGGNAAAPGREAAAGNATAPDREETAGGSAAAPGREGPPAPGPAAGGEVAGAVPRYVIELPDGFTTDPAGTLFLSLADADESPDLPEHLQPDEDAAADGQQDGVEALADEHEADDEAAARQEQAGDPPPGQEAPASGNAEDDDGEGDDEEGPREPLDLTVRLVDAAGVAADVPLSRFSLVQPQLEVELRKALLDEPRRESEAVFQSFLFPLAWFLEAAPALDASRPARIELVFDRSPSGVVILDTVGFRLKAAVPGS